jgi:hypothetical protein
MSSAVESGIPYGVLQAVWQSGHISSPRDRAALSLACPETRPWFREYASARRAAMRAQKADPFFACRYNENFAYVSRWRKQDAGTLPHGCAMSVYIDLPDAETLREICAWVGRSAPRHLYFFTTGQKGPCETLTDEMLLLCATNAVVLQASSNRRITDASVRHLTKCQHIAVQRCSICACDSLCPPDTPLAHSAWRVLKPSRRRY